MNDADKTSEMSFTDLIPIRRRESDLGRLSDTSSLLHNCYVQSYLQEWQS